MTVRYDENLDTKPSWICYGHAILSQFFVLIFSYLTIGILFVSAKNDVWVSFIKCPIVLYRPVSHLWPQATFFIIHNDK